MDADAISTIEVIGQTGSDHEYAILGYLAFARTKLFNGIYGGKGIIERRKKMGKKKIVASFVYVL